MQKKKKIKPEISDELKFTFGDTLAAVLASYIQLSCIRKTCGFRFKT